MEIERKFLIKTLPKNLAEYDYHHIVQGYLNTSPVVRIRKEDNDYYLTYKGSGMLAREEYNLPLTKESFEHMLPKCDGNIIAKKRHLIPMGDVTIELDVFEAPFEALILAEVEFDSIEAAKAFIMPDWFLQDVTYDPAYHNSNMSQRII
ncbi:MAG: CYTH domain-containing protein [Lachnospiraceae bacterium]